MLNFMCNFNGFLKKQCYTFVMVDIHILILNTLTKYSKQYYTYIHDKTMLLCDPEHIHEDTFHALVTEITGLLMMHNVDYELHEDYNISLVLN